MDGGTVEASLAPITVSCVEVLVMPIRMRLSSLVFDYCLHHIHCNHIQCNHLHCNHIHCITYTVLMYTAFSGWKLRAFGISLRPSDALWWAWCLRWSTNFHELSASVVGMMPASRLGDEFGSGAWRSLLANSIVADIHWSVRRETSLTVLNFSGKEGLCAARDHCCLYFVDLDWAPFAFIPVSRTPVALHDANLAIFL